MTEATSGAILVRQGGDGVAYPLAGAAERIAGRDDGCDVRIEHEELSRRHARFAAVGDGGWTVEDLDSANGVTVNGRPVASAVRLCAGDTVGLGPVVLEYRGPGPRPAPLPGRRRMTLLAGAAVTVVAVLMAAVILPLGTHEPGAPADGPVREAVAPRDVVPREEVAPSVPAADAVSEPVPVPESDAAVSPVDRSLAPPPAVGFAELVDRQAGLTRVYRYAANPNVLVVDYSSLIEQARALNRVFALVEENGTPRDRVLDDAAMAAYMEATGVTPETFALGHDYTAADLGRFFTLAERDGIALNAEELVLRGQLEASGFLARDGTGWVAPPPARALVSVPQRQADDPATVEDESIAFVTRASILQHELSHGEFFTNAAYRDYCFAFWDRDLGEAERGAFRRFLAGAGYTGGRLLTVNEMQAYLVHTTDPEIFDGAKVGLNDEQMEVLRTRFLAGAPASAFLSDVLGGEYEAARTSGG